jgi:hypothetical protein
MKLHQEGLLGFGDLRQYLNASRFLDAPFSPVSLEFITVYRYRKTGRWRLSTTSIYLFLSACINVKIKQWKPDWKKINRRAWQDTAPGGPHDAIPNYTSIYLIFLLRISMILSKFEFATRSITSPNQSAHNCPNEQRYTLSIWRSRSW